MTPAIFVTGTDTGCGKTAVACALVRSLRGAGRRVRVLKPVETGCALRGGQARPADALALAAVAGDPTPLERICPYRLQLAASPEVAARAEGVKIQLEPIASALAGARREADAVIVEGAGGLLVPLGAERDMAELARELDLAILIVARAALGTLNHTLLTLGAARERGLEIIGVAISHTQPDLSEAERLNLDSLIERLPVRFWGELDHGAPVLRPELDARTLLVAAGGA